MRAPGITYRYIYPKDVAGPTFEIVAISFNQPGTLATIINNFQGVPKDKVLVLTNAVLIAVPGAAQTIDDIHLDYFTGAGQQIQAMREQPAAAAAQSVTMNWAGEIYLNGRGAGITSVSMAAVFNAGVASNRLVSSISGIVIPRGNSSLF